MKSTGVISWINEHTLTPYPLLKGFGYNGLLVDAKFIQFENHIPVLKEITLDDTELKLVISFDTGDKELVVNISALNVTKYVLRIYDNTRFLGKLIFGPYAYRFATEEMVNQTFKNLNIPFLTHTVKSIPYKAGVFMLQNQYAAVDVSNSDDTITVVADTEENALYLDAAALPEEKNNLYLKTINSVAPVNNGIFLVDNTLIKYSSLGQSQINVSLVGNDVTSEDVLITNG